MQTRPTITFEATYKGEADDGQEELRCLTAAGEFTTDRSQAARFKVFVGLTNMQRARAEIRRHEIAGGFEDWSDLTRAINRGRAVIIARLEKRIWPEGRPDAKGVERKEQAEAIDKAWRESDDVEIQNVHNLRVLKSRIDFMAEWEFLRAEVPKGWESLADRTDDETVFMVLWNSYESAHEAYSRGKTKPS